MITRGSAAGRWDDIGCNDVTSALCESRNYGRGIEYFILKDAREQTYSYWSQRCEAKGGHIASIRDGKEQAAAEKAMRSAKRVSVLTGMKRKFKHSKTFIDIFGHVISYG